MAKGTCLQFQCFRRAFLKQNVTVILGFHQYKHAFWLLSYSFKGNEMCLSKDLLKTVVLVLSNDKVLTRSSNYRSSFLSADPFMSGNTL